LPFFWLLILGSVWAPPLAHAANITVGFTAIVFYLDNFCWCLPETIALGDTLVGYYVYESPAVDTDPDPRSGRYVYSTAPTALVAYLEGYKFESDPANVNIVFTVQDSLETTSGPRDRLVFSSQANKVVPFDGYAPSRMFVTFHDATLQGLSDDSLPTSPPDLNIWTSAHGIQINGATWVLAANIISTEWGPPTGIKSGTTSFANVHVYNVPNPFGTSTSIQWSGLRGPVSLQIFDAGGRLIRTLHTAAKSSERSVLWDARDENDQPVASGIYFVRLATPVVNATRKMILIR
jgi:hypothetical protein